MPTRIGPYRIREVIGEGGMGVVYRAEDPATSQRVALKTVRIAHEKYLSSMRREIRALRRVRHPGVVRVLAEGVEGGRPWYAMELLEGITLADFRAELWPVPCTGGPAAGGRLGDVLTAIRRLLVPIGFLHGEGVVHGDLKPQNVFLRTGAHPVLVDFGLAWGAAGARGREVLDVIAEVIGTPSYMAPEQIRGDLVDARVDLYAVGCLLYELLTGEPPFVGESAADVMAQHLTRSAPAPSARVLGVPPALDSLVAELLEKEPRRRLGHADDVMAALDALGADPGPDIGAPRARDYVYRPQMTGREDALAVLAERLADARESRGGVCLIAGESGIGKTYLALEAVRRAGGAFRIIVGTCAPVGMGRRGARGAPLHPLLPLLAAVADRCTARGADEADDLLGPRGKVLAAIDPTLARLPGQERYPDPPGLTGAAERERLLAALADTLSAFAERDALLLVLDDLQWADELTLQFLSGLPGDYFAAAGILVLGTYRSDEDTPALAALRGRPYCAQLALGRLPRTCVARLVRDMLAVDYPPASFVAALARASEGNPFFVAEYLRTAAAEGVITRTRERGLRVGASPGERQDLEQALALPKSLRELVTRRLAGLSSSAQQLLEVAAVVGREFDPDLVSAASGLDEGEALEAVAELVSRQVVEPSSGADLRFVHDKLCEVAYGDLPARRRRRLHARAALTMEASAGDRLPERYAALAHHYLEAREADKAREYLQLAGDRAMTQSAYAEASEFWRRLLVLDAEQAESGRAAPAAVRARWLRRLGEACFNLGELEAADRNTRAALATLGKRLPERPMGWAWLVGRELARQAVGRARSRRRAERPGAEEAAAAASTMAWRYYFTNDALGVVSMSLLSANEADRTHGVGDASPHAWLGYAAGSARLHRQARFYFERARDIARASGDPSGAVLTDLMEGIYHTAFGNWREAETAARRGLEALAGAGDPQNVERLQTLLASICYYRGRFAESTELFDSVLASARGRRNVQHEAWGLYARALGLVARGRLDESIVGLEEARAMLAAQEDMASQIICHGMLSLARLRCGEDGAALEMARDAAGRIARVGSAVFTTIAGYGATAEVFVELYERGGTGRARLRREVLRTERALHKFAVTFPFGAPQAWRYLGQRLAIEGKRRLARRALGRAVVLGERFGMPYDQAQAHLLLERYELGTREDGARGREMLERLGAAHDALGPG